MRNLKYLKKNIQEQVYGAPHFHGSQAIALSPTLLSVNVFWSNFSLKVEPATTETRESSRTGDEEEVTPANK